MGVRYSFEVGEETTPQKLQDKLDGLNNIRLVGIISKSSLAGIDFLSSLPPAAAVLDWHKMGSLRCKRDQILPSLWSTDRKSLGIAGLKNGKLAEWTPKRRKRKICHTRLY